MRALVAGEIFLLEHLHHGLQRLAPDFAAMLGISVEAEPFHDVGSGAASRAEFALGHSSSTSSVAENALGDHERVVARHQDHGETEPYGLRALRQCGQEHLGSGAMADLGENAAR